MNPTKEQVSTIRIRDVRAVRSRNEIWGLIPGAGVVSPSMSVVHKWYVMIRKHEPPEFLTENDSIPYAAMS